MPSLPLQYNGPPCSPKRVLLLAKCDCTLRLAKTSCKWMTTSAKKFISNLEAKITFYPLVAIAIRSHGALKQKEMKTHICQSGNLLCLRNAKVIETVHEGQLPNLFDNWADSTSSLVSSCAPCLPAVAQPGIQGRAKRRCCYLLGPFWVSFSIAISRFKLTRCNR